LSLNPNAISLLKVNQDKINWHYLSSNPCAISLLEKKIDKINWCELSKNPGIFKKKRNIVIRVISYIYKNIVNFYKYFDDCHYKNQYYCSYY